MKTQNQNKKYTLSSYPKNSIHGDIETTYNLQSEKLFLNLSYTIGKCNTEDKFSIKSNLPKTGQISLLESFLSSHISKKEEKISLKIGKPYHISLKYSPESRSDRRFVGDRIEVSYDTKNQSLRDGIIMRVLGSLV